MIASVKDEQLRVKVISILSDRIAPQRLEQTAQALKGSGDSNAILRRMMPADTFYLAAEFRKKYPAEAVSLGPAGQQLEIISSQHPTEVSWERLSKDFGVPLLRFCEETPGTAVRGVLFLEERCQKPVPLLSLR